MADLSEDLQRPFGVGGDQPSCSTFTRLPFASLSSRSIDELRRRAYEAVASTAGKSGKAAKRIYLDRSAAVRDYVLARANGECEACKEPAPFSRPDGSPYLEPHHIRRMSDGGPDHPKWVGAICPNCHKEIHYGANGKTINSRLQRYVEKLEAKCSE